MEKHYSERDLQISEDLGGMKTAIMGFAGEFTELKECIKSHFREETKHREIMWSRIDETKNDIARQDKELSRIKGIGLGIQAVIVVILGWLGLHR